MTPATGTPMLQETNSTQLEAMPRGNQSPTPETSFATVLQDASDPLHDQQQIFPSGKHEVQNAKPGEQVKASPARDLAKQVPSLLAGIGLKKVPTVPSIDGLADATLLPKSAEDGKDAVALNVAPAPVPAREQNLKAGLPLELSIKQDDAAQIPAPLAKPEDAAVATGAVKDTKDSKSSKALHAVQDVAALCSVQAAGGMISGVASDVPGGVPALVLAAVLAAHPASTSPLAEEPRAAILQPRSTLKTAPVPQAIGPAAGKAHTPIPAVTATDEKPVGLHDVSAAVIEAGTQTASLQVPDGHGASLPGLTVAAVQSPLPISAAVAPVPSQQGMQHESGLVSAGLVPGSAGLPGSLPMAMLAAGPTALEVGVANGTHGWLKIRAELAGPGQVNASLSPVSPAAAGQLREQIPALASYLQAEKIHIGELTVQTAFHAAGPQQAPVSSETSVDVQGSLSGSVGGGREGAAPQQFADDAGRAVPGEDEPHTHQEVDPLRYGRGTGLGGDSMMPLAGYGTAGAWLNVRA